MSSSTLLPHTLDPYHQLAVRDLESLAMGVRCPGMDVPSPIHRHVVAAPTLRSMHATSHRGLGSGSIKISAKPSSSTAGLVSRKMPHRLANDSLPGYLKSTATARHERHTHGQLPMSIDQGGITWFRKANVSYSATLVSSQSTFITSPSRRWS